MISSLKKKYPQYLLWFFVLSAIVLNALFTIATTINLKTPVFNQLFLQILSPFENIRYGRYLAQKWFLVAIAFITYIWWLKYHKISLKETVKKNIVPICIIFVASLITHFATFKGWFWVDDFRVISQYFGPPVHPQTLACCAHSYYSLAVMFLVIQWFGNNFALYNALGVLMNILAGVGVFFLFNKLQKNKVLSLLTALFFITTPTYYREVWEMIEWTGNGFSLLLVVLTVYFLISEFWPGALIFTAAVLEFGLGRTNFIPLPLILIAIFFVAKNKLWKKEFLAKLALLSSLPLIYLPLFLTQNRVPHSKLNIFVLADSVLSVTIPHEILRPIAEFLRSLRMTSFYMIPFLGIVLVLFLLIITAWFFYKKKAVSAKFLLIGLTVVISSLVFPSIFGTQINRDISKMLEYHTNPLPIAATIYGLMPAFGLAFIVAGFGTAMRFTLFKKIILVLIVLNAITFARYHFIRNKDYGFPLRTMNSQLVNLLPADGSDKFIYVPSEFDILWYGVRDFRNIYRASEKYYSVNTASAFIKLITEHNPPSSQVYFFTIDKKTLEIHNRSEEIRKSYPRNINLETLK